MAIIVQKYGGTSVGSLSRIEAVADNVISTVRQGHQVVVVLSAMSGETNRLIALAKQLDKQPATRELDMLMASGEQVSIALLSIALIQRGFSAVSLLANQVGILTNNDFGRAKISSIDTVRFTQAFEQGQIVVVAGFQGVDAEGNITTLGRGGSDTSAVAMAAAIKASECQIFTDVDGIYTADPRKVKLAQKISAISFEEALTMASFGAKVLQNRAVEYALRHNTPLRVLSSFSEGAGTLVTHKDTLIAELNRECPVTGIAHHEFDALVSINGVTSEVVVADIFVVLGDAGVEIEMLNQSHRTDGLIDLQFVINRQDLHKLTLSLQNMNKKSNFSGIQTNPKVAKISAIGVGIKAYSGVVGKLLSALINEHIRVLLISTSELSVSVVVDESKLETAISRLHNVFGLDSKSK